MPRLLLLFALFLGLNFAGLRAETASPMRLHSREPWTALTFSLADSDWRWLGEKRELKVGVYGPENPPFDLVVDNDTLEGLSSDYTALILQSLGLRFQIVYYADRVRALNALSNGESDLLIDDGGGQRQPDHALLQSRQFVADHPVLVSRETSMSDLDPLPAGSKIAMADGYLSDSWVEASYPGIRIMRFPSAQSALASVAFGENDYFIGNLISASYLIERNYASTLSVVHVFKDQNTGPRFIFSADNAPLQRSINTALDAMTPRQHELIFAHWSQGLGVWKPAAQLQLTDKERRWLEQHKALRVVVNSMEAPFTLSDSRNRFNGMAADLLRLIHLRTGINFTMVEAATLSGMVAMVQHHEADFIGSLPFSPGREEKVLFTRPYARPPYVMVSQNTLTTPMTLAATRTLAITPDHALTTWLSKNYPKIKLIVVENTSIALQMVDEGRVDGAVNNLIAARYMIDRYFRGRLTIATRLGEEPARIAFGVARDNPELLSILNKALAAIPPRDISQLATKWQGTPDIKLETWLTYRREFYWLAGILALLGLTSAFWNYHLHRAVRLRKEAQVSLQQQATFLETLFNGTPVPVCVINTAGKLINHNPAWEQFFRHSTDAIHALQPSSAGHPLHAIYQTQAAQSGDGGYCLVPQRGKINNGVEDRDVIYQFEAFCDTRGSITGLICSWQDITDHQRLLADLSLAREHAEQANRTKSTFLATMSHEIRTPISAIIGLLELAVTQHHRQEDHESVRVAYESSLSLMGLIGDILDMAKIESGKLELSPEWVRFDTLTAPVVRVFEGLSRQKGLRLHHQVDILHPDELLLDPMRLRQILSNLIGNAIKFTSHGSVEVQVHCLPDRHEQAILEMVVTDTGIGISEAEQRLIFNPYEQSEAGKKQSGTGLGLAICEQLVAMMNGTIQLRSRPKRGTRICVRIPVLTRETKILPGQNAPLPGNSSLPLTILTVDDHPANRLLLKRQLTRLGHTVIEAENGEQALTLWHQHNIQLVITDCNMPVMDGFELTRRLRNQQPGGLTIMGLTANAQPEERVRCLAAGMDKCLFKPLRLPQLEALLAGIPRLSGAAQWQPDTLSTLLDIRALRELVHDDDEMLTRLLCTTRDENLRDIQVAGLCFDEDDLPGMTRSLHRMAGSARIIGAIKVATLCANLETRCGQPGGYAIEAQTLDAVLGEVLTLNQAIDDFIAAQPTMKRR
ncbi:transporter substrate-binding domain-containing protein [Enterobacter sp. Ap-916]|nr:transporter substrate-binding domain-containing protein [Enterobacter sp. Ap-867]NIG28056.1 transporter substrate-binding domain-containing protein [Enterobacter sp. Ap-916]